MATVTIKMKDGSHIPRDSTVVVVSLPFHGRVFKAKRVSRAAMVELDRGLYRTVLHRFRVVNGIGVGFKEVSEVYVGVTREQNQKLLQMPRKHTVPVSRNNCVTFRCKAPGCDIAGLTSPTEAILHELEDHGEKAWNLDEKIPPVEEIEPEVDDPGEPTLPPVEKIMRKRGRPPGGKNAPSGLS